MVAIGKVPTIIEDLIELIEIIWQYAKEENEPTIISKKEEK